MPDVKCSVRNCVHWENDNKCTASSIQVMNYIPQDVPGEAETSFNPDDFEEPDMEVGEEPADIKMSGLTCCKTMKPRK